MTPTEIEEYNALRATIRERGTTRVWVVFGGTVAWAAAALLMVALGAPPLVGFIPLLVLATTFEIVFALHIGVERVGRYIQVFFEHPPGGGWEHRIMEFARVGPTRVTTDPLFARCFALAAILNLIPPLIVGPVAVEWIALTAGHALFAGRILVARRQAADQRAADLAAFREIKNRGE